MKTKQKKRNTKKFKKNLRKRNHMIRQHSNHNITDWFNKTFNKVFNYKKYNELIELLQTDSSTYTSKELLKSHELRNTMGINLIQNILKNKNVIRKLLKFLIKYRFEDYPKLFQQFIYLPFNVVGNKFMEGFDEYYNFISEFSMSSIIDYEEDRELEVFRVMEESEYLNLLVGNGIESPSFTTNPFYLQYLRGNYTLFDTSKKSVFVLCKFKMGDIIINYDMSKEGEVVIKKGSKPTMIKKFNEYGIDDVVDDLGKDVLNFLPLTKEEVNNGFTYMDGLKEKGYDLSKEYYRNEGGQWNKVNGTGTIRFVDRLYKSIGEVVFEHCDENSSPSFIGIKVQIQQMIDMGEKLLNNPFSELKEELKVT